MQLQHFFHFSVKSISDKKKYQTCPATVPWLLIKSFEKSDFASKWLKNVQNVQKMDILQIFPWDFPMGVLKIEVYPMGQCMAFLISACCPDSKAVEILKIGWVCNSLPYLHMGLRDLTFTPYNVLINSNMVLWVKCDENLWK